MYVVRDLHKMAFKFLHSLIDVTRYVKTVPNQTCTIENQTFIFLFVHK